MQKNTETIHPAPQTQTTRPAVQQVPKPAPPPELQSAQIEGLDQTALLRILKEPGSETPAVYRKAMACRRLAVIGTKDVVPAVAALLIDERLSDYARETLEALPDQAAGAALCAALPKLKGTLQIGVINSLGRRRDSAALESLVKLIHATDAAVAQAASIAVGEIGGTAAARALQPALAKIKGSVRESVASAALLCAQRLMPEDRRAAFDLLEILTRQDIPKNVRDGALYLQLVTDTSLGRPRTAPPVQK